MTRDVTLDLPIADAAAIRRAAGSCLKRVDLSKRLRLLGVRIGNLNHPGERIPAKRTVRRADSGRSAATAAEPKLESLDLF